MENIKSNTIITLRFSSKLDEAEKLTAEALNKSLENLKKKFKIKSSEILEPSLDENGRAYTGHLELDIIFKNLEEMFSFVYDFTPSSFEIYEPEKLEIPAPVFTGELNDLTGTILNITNQKQGLEYSLKSFCKAVFEILNNTSKDKKKLQEIQTELEKYYIPARENDKKQTN